MSVQTPIKPFNNITPKLDSTVYVEQSAVLYGDIEIGSNSSIWPLVAIRGDVNYVRIGKNTNVQDGSVLHVSRTSKQYPDGFPLIIGDDVTVGHKCMLHGCIVGDRVLIGMGAIVMDGVEVGDDVIIGAGTVVPPNKKLESGYLYVGNPMQKKRPLNAGEIAFLAESAANYVLLKNEYQS